MPEVERGYIEEEMGMMREYHGPQNVFQPGVHVGLCNMRPNLERGFHIVVRKEQSHAIPTSPLGLSCLEKEQKACALEFTGQTVRSIITELSNQADNTKLSSEVHTFRLPFPHLATKARKHLHLALVTLAAEVNDEAAMESVLLPEIFQFTAISQTGKSSRDTATLLILRNVSPVHSSHQPLSTSHLAISPLSLFLLVQQSVLTDVRSTFAKEAREEFLRLFKGTQCHSAPQPPDLESWVFGPFMEEGKMKVGLGKDSDVPSVEGGTGLVQHRRITPPGSSGTGNRISGIVVHKSVAVTVRENDPDDVSTLSGAVSKEGGLGATMNLMDDVTWADLLFKGILCWFRVFLGKLQAEISSIFSKQEIQSSTHVVCCRLIWSTVKIWSARPELLPMVPATPGVGSGTSIMETL